MRICVVMTCRSAAQWHNQHIFYAYLYNIDRYNVSYSCSTIEWEDAVTKVTKFLIYLYARILWSDDSEDRVQRL